MPDLRYHVISLVAVFLAIAIGVLLGTAMADRGVLDGQLQAQIRDIEADLERQRGDLEQQRELIAEREAEIAELEREMGAMSEAMISDKLEGVDVALVSGPWAAEETVQRIESDLSSAGVDFTTRIRLDPGAQDPEALQARYVEVGREVIAATGGTEDPEVIVFVGGGEPPEDAPEGSLEALTAAQKAMFEVWTEVDLRVVAAESSTTERTEIPLFQDVGVPSVDNADQPIGRAAIVQLARTVADGSYGTKPSASEPFPTTPS